MSVTNHDSAINPNRTRVVCVCVCIIDDIISMHAHGASHAHTTTRARRFDFYGEILLLTQSRVRTHTRTHPRTRDRSIDRSWFSIDRSWFSIDRLIDHVVLERRTPSISVRSPIDGRPHRGRSIDFRRGFARAGRGPTTRDRDGCHR